METNKNFCCGLTNEPELLKQGLLDLMDEMDVEQLQRLYLHALQISRESALEDAAKRAMMDYIAERMEKASPERVHMLYICSINVLD